MTSQTSTGASMENHLTGSTRWLINNRHVVKKLCFIVNLCLKPFLKPLVSYVEKQGCMTIRQSPCMLRLHSRPVYCRHWLAQQCNQCRATKKHKKQDFQKKPRQVIKRDNNKHNEPKQV